MMDGDSGDEGNEELAMKVISLHGQEADKVPW